MTDDRILLPGLPIVERAFSRVLSNSETWFLKREQLSFGTYHREKAKCMAKNDWPTIALSVVTGHDMRD